VFGLQIGQLATGYSVVQEQLLQVLHLAEMQGCFFISILFVFRLHESGLTAVNWVLVNRATRVPKDDKTWQDEFERYKGSAEYRL
jgi:heme A synthase